MRKQILAVAGVLIAALGLIGAAQAKAQPRPAGKHQPIANCTTPPVGSIPLPQHYLSYTVTGTTGFKPPPPQEVTLENPISGSFQPTAIGKAIWHWNPSCKFRAGETFNILNANVHYLCFSITAKTQVIPNQFVTDQFVQGNLQLGQPDALCLPSWKSLTGVPTQKGQPGPADHYVCYPVVNPPATSTPVQVQDEFSPSNPVNVTVGNAQQLCVPTQKTVAGKVFQIKNPKLNYLCHTVTQTPIINPVFDKNQFGAGRVNIGMTNFLCAPTTVAAGCPMPGPPNNPIAPPCVASGLATDVSVPTTSCTAGTTPTSVTGFPAPNGTTTNLQADLSPAPKPARIIGVWPAPSGGSTQSYTITLTCSNGTKQIGTVQVEPAPEPTDFVGVGSDTIQNVMDQFSSDYNGTHASGPYLYSWDATNPVTGAIGDSIATKQGCTPIPRPDGSSAGITALTTENGTTDGNPCMDFARSSRARSSSDPTSITFVTLAGDAVTYATQPGSEAPGNLTTAQLTGIYNCTITNWSQVGGSNDPINAFLPQSGSGTRSFFLTALGLTAPGSCVSTSATQFGAAGASDNTLQENEGVAPSLNGNCTNGPCPTADAIFPYSVGKYLAERFHSASCGGVSGCYPTAKCTPTGSQDEFGCDTHGTMDLNMINSTNPTVPFPPTSKSVTNSAFTPTFTRFLYEVVNSPEFSIPAYLQPVFGPTGWVCTNSTAKTDLTNYGFIVLPAGTAAGDCGSLS